MCRIFDGGASSLSAVNAGPRTATARAAAAGHAPAFRRFRRHGIAGNSEGNGRRYLLPSFSSMTTYGSVMLLVAWWEIHSNMALASSDSVEAWETNFCTPAGTSTGHTQQDPAGFPTENVTMCRCMCHFCSLHSGSRRAEVAVAVAVEASWLRPDSRWKG